MVKKISILCFISVFFITSGFGCKGLSEEEKVSVRPVILEYWTVYNDVNQLKKFATEFNTQKPNIKINIKKVRYEEFDNLLLNALADDVAPDIVSVNVRDLHKYANRLSAMPETVKESRLVTTGQYFKETVLETNSLPMPSTRYVKSSYIKTVYDDVVINKNIYGLPLAMDTLVLYYNEDLLDRAGFAEPPQTWDDFISQVKASTKFDSNGNILQSGVALGTGKNINNAFDILSLFLLQSKVTIATGNYVGFASGINPSNFDEHSTIKALNFYTDFARPNKDVYTWDNTQGQALQEFARGKTTFYFGFAYDMPNIKSLAPQMNLEVVPVPQLNPEDPVNVANYWVESVVEKSKDKNEAWDFVRFITTPDKVKEYTKITGQPTPLRSQIAEQKEDEVLGPFVVNILNIENWYRGRDYTVAKEAIIKMLESYLEPFVDNTKQSEAQYKAGLITNAARIVQQTM